MALPGIGPGYFNGSRYAWSWPFVDVFPCDKFPGKVRLNRLPLGTNFQNSFLFAQNEIRCAYRKIPYSMMFPLRPIYFEGTVWYGPRKAEEMADKSYGGVNSWRTTCASIYYNHRVDAGRVCYVSRSYHTRFCIN